MRDLRTILTTFCIGAGLAFAILIFVLVLAAIIAVGLVGAKLIYRYSRSAVLALTWLVFHFGYFYLAFSLGDGKGDTARSGFEVLSQDYLWGVPSFYVYLIDTFLFVVVSAVMFSKLDDEAKALAAEEADKERNARQGVELFTKILLGAGAGFIGYKAGRMVGESLL